MVQSEQNNFSNAKIALDKVFKHFNLIYNG
jgi:hypothetical protein